MQILRGGLPDALAAFAAFAYVEDRHAHVMVNVDLSALAGSDAVFFTVTRPDGDAGGQVIRMHCGPRAGQWRRPSG